jgi:hypothetical protein
LRCGPTANLRREHDGFTIGSDDRVAVLIDFRGLVVSVLSRRKTLVGFPWVIGELEVPQDEHFFPGLRAILFHISHPVDMLSGIGLVGMRRFVLPISTTVGR